MARAIPSVKALHEGLRLSMPTAATLRDDLASAHDEGNAAVEDALRAANRFMDGHGVEAINDERGPRRGYWWNSNTRGRSGTTSRRTPSSSCSAAGATG